MNIAFAGTLAFVWEMSMEQFRRITEVTYYGQVHGTLAARDLMRPRDRGVIINVGLGDGVPLNPRSRRRTAGPGTRSRASPRR